MTHAVCTPTNVEPIISIRYAFRWENASSISERSEK